MRKLGILYTRYQDMEHFRCLGIKHVLVVQNCVLPPVLLFNKLGSKRIVQMGQRSVQLQTYRSSLLIVLILYDSKETERYKFITNSFAKTRQLSYNQSQIDVNFPAIFIPFSARPNKTQQHYITIQVLNIQIPDNSASQLNIPIPPSHENPFYHSN